MLDLQRPVARLARRFRPTGGHGSVQGSLGLKSGVGAASGGASSAAPTKRSHFFVLVTNFCVSFSLVTSRVLVASACPSKGGRGQLRRSAFPSLMRLRHPGVKLEHKGHIYFTIVDFFIIQNGCYCRVLEIWFFFYHILIISVAVNLIGHRIGTRGVPQDVLYRTSALLALRPF